jgi:hypothetical protein
MDKKNEDVAMVAQIDKTSVFQEGTVGLCYPALARVRRLTLPNSSSVQSEPDITTQMQSCMLRIAFEALWQAHMFRRF